MDLTYNEIQSMLSDSVGRFIDAEYGFERRQAIAASDAGYDAEVWRQFAELGFTAVPLSEDDGGIGGGPIELAIIMREFGRGLVVEPYLANVVLAGGVLRRLANAEQKTRWLAPMTAGELQATLAFMEPQSRYELANIATSAERTGSGWTLTGSKGVVPNGGNAELVIVPARTSDSGDADGISLFAVHAGADGVSRRTYATVDGHRAAELRFEDVRVDDDALLGDPGGGFEALDATLLDATLAVSAEAIGIMRTLTDKTVEYSKNRVQFGVPISSFQALQHRMVEMLTDCEQSQSLLLWASMLADADDPGARRAISSLKYQVGTAGRRIGQEAVQLHGGMGVTWELDIAHYFKRLTVIDQVFGNADWHLDRLAG